MEGEKSSKKNTDICYTVAWPEGPILFVYPSARHYFKQKYSRYPGSVKINKSYKKQGGQIYCQRSENAGSNKTCYREWISRKRTVQLLSQTHVDFNNTQQHTRQSFNSIKRQKKVVLTENNFQHAQWYKISFGCWDPAYQNLTAEL